MLSNLPAVIVVLFLAVILGIAFWGVRKTKNVGDFFLGGKTLGPWLLAVSYGTTYFSAVVFIGFAGQYGWLCSFESLWVAIGNALAGGALAWLVLGRRTRIMTQRLGVMTMPEFFAVRYCSNGMKIISAIIIFLFLLPYSASVFGGLGFLFKETVGLSMTAVLTIITAFCAFYVVLGGYKAVARIDFVQGIIMFFGAILMVVFIVQANGGFWKATQNAHRLYQERVQIAQADVLSGNAEKEQSFSSVQKSSEKSTTEKPTIEKSAEKSSENIVKVETANEIFTTENLSEKLSKNNAEDNVKTKTEDIAENKAKSNAENKAKSNTENKAKSNAESKAKGNVKDVSVLSVKKMPPLIFWSVVFMTSFAVWGMPQMVQKYYAISDEKQIVRGAVITTIFALVIGFAAYYSGALVHLLPTDQLIAADGTRVDFNSMVPLLLLNTLPKWLLTVILLLVLSASMSTLSSLVMVSSSAVGIDLYKGYFRPQQSDKHYLTVMRGLIILFVLISYLIALFNPSWIVPLMSLSWGTIAGAFLSPFIYGLFWKRTTKWGAYSGMFSGVLIANSLYWYLFMSEGASAAKAYSPFSATVAMIVPFFIVPVVSLMTSPVDEDTVRQAFGDSSKSID